MPSPVNAAQRHPFPKARYRVKNWSEYDRALQERGSLTVWVTPEAIAAWQAPPTGQRGRPPQYSDLAIEDRASATLGLWSTVAADRRAPAFDCHFTWVNSSIDLIRRKGSQLGRDCSEGP